jgi:hypothetical protein
VLLFGGVSAGKTTADSCAIAARIPESLGARPLEYCRIESPFLTQVKLNGAYTIPKADVLVGATFQSIPGPVVQAN